MIGGLEKVNNAMLEYTDLKSPIHKLTGATKLIALIIWAITAMVTYDTRVLILMFILSIVFFKIFFNNSYGIIIYGSYKSK